MVSLKIIIPLILGIIVTTLMIFSINSAPSQNASHNINGNETTQINILSTNNVATHNSQSNCWTIINNKVYDITTYIKIHPGGPIITKACGVDGTELFATKGGAGREHSSIAKKILDQYLVGEIGSIPKQENTTVNKNNTIAINTTKPSINTSNIKTNYDFIEVTKHNSISSCWIIIEGNIYDVTNFMSIHPGGIAMIKNNCGSEATNAFKTKGGSGNDHSSYAWKLLKDYLIGPLIITLNDPPIATITAPTNNEQLDSGTTSVTLIVNTDKNAICKWSSSDKNYSSMINSFSVSGGKVHSTKLTGLQDGSSYNRYVRCISNNISAVSSTKVSFSVKAPIVASGLTLTDVALHNSQNSCYLIINNKVYDVTTYISVHPGGVAMITNNCGTDATNAFNTKGGTGGTHSSTAKNLLAGYYVGDLVTTIINLTQNNTINCTGVSSQSCTITNGVGQQSRTCSNGIWSGWSTCVVTSCNSGYTLTNGQCISNTVTNTVFTAADVLMHSSLSSCYLIINNKVYNVTSFISVHPGGITMITNNCGKESTNAFNTKGGSGSSHSTYANNLLATYFIGNLTTITNTNTTCNGSSTQSCTITNGVGSQSRTCNGTIWSSWGTCTATSCNNGYTYNNGQCVIITYPTYTMAQVALHSTQSDCYLMINNKVYDVTTYITIHPGGVTRITNNCGKNATAPFNNQGHSNTAKNILSGFFLGNLSTTTCIGSNTQSCTITNGVGSQNGTCIGTTWNWGTCTVTSCNNGYQISGNTCILTTCSGSSIQSCTITNGTGSQTGTCTNGAWVWGTCTVTSCNNGYQISGNTCIVAPLTPKTVPVTITSSGTLNISTINLNIGDTLQVIYTNPGNEINVVFNPTPPSTMKLDHEFTTKSYTFTTAGTWSFGKSGSLTGTIIVQ